MSYPVRRGPRWATDPFAEVQALRAELGRMFGTALAGTATGGLVPEVEVDSDEEGWTVTARLAGVAPEEVEIEVDDRELRIRARTAEETGAGQEEGIEDVIAAGQTGEAGTAQPGRARAGEARAGRAGAGRSEESIEDVIAAGQTGEAGTAERGRAPGRGGPGAEGGEVIRPRTGGRQRARGMFDFRVALPGDVDVDRVDATMDHGLLTVRLPRKTRAGRRQITIH